jgi:hypothetical protein
MKKVILKQFNNEIGHAVVSEEKLSEMVAIYLDNYKGASERWVEAIEGTYSQADVLEEKETLVTPGVPAEVNELGEITKEASPAIFVKEVKLKAEYTVDVIDLSSDYDYQLQECIKNRIQEYPKPEDFMNAYFDGGEVALNELRTKRLSVKAKYQKPVKE